MDPDPGERAGGGRERRRERGERRRGRREGEGRRAVLRLLFLGEGDEGAEMMLDLDPYQFVQTTKHKDDNDK